jgi:hypothetical protein
MQENQYEKRKNNVARVCLSYALRINKLALAMSFLPHVSSPVYAAQCVTHLVMHTCEKERETRAGQLLGVHLSRAGAEHCVTAEELLEKLCADSELTLCTHILPASSLLPPSTSSASSSSSSSHAFVDVSSSNSSSRLDPLNFFFVLQSLFLAQKKYQLAAQVMVKFHLIVARYLSNAVSAAASAPILTHSAVSSQPSCMSLTLNTLLNVIKTHSDPLLAAIHALQLSSSHNSMTASAEQWVSVDLNSSAYLSSSSSSSASLHINQPSSSSTSRLTVSSAYCETRYVLLKTLIDLIAMAITVPSWSVSSTSSASSAEFPDASTLAGKVHSLAVSYLRHAFDTTRHTLRKLASDVVNVCIVAGCFESAVTLIDQFDLTEKCHTTHPEDSVNASFTVVSSSDNTGDMHQLVKTVAYQCALLHAGAQRDTAVEYGCYLSNQSIRDVNGDSDGDGDYFDRKPNKRVCVYCHLKSSNLVDQHDKQANSSLDMDVDVCNSTTTCTKCIMKAMSLHHVPLQHRIGSISWETIKSDTSNKYHAHQAYFEGLANWFREDEDVQVYHSSAISSVGVSADAFASASSVKVRKSTIMWSFLRRILSQYNTLDTGYIFPLVAAEVLIQMSLKHNIKYNSRFHDYDESNPTQISQGAAPVSGPSFGFSAGAVVNGNNDDLSEKHITILPLWLIELILNQNSITRTNANTSVASAYGVGTRRKRSNQAMHTTVASMSSLHGWSSQYASVSVVDAPGMNSSAVSTTNATSSFASLNSGALTANASKSISKGDAMIMLVPLLRLLLRYDDCELQCGLIFLNYVLRNKSASSTPIHSINALDSAHSRYGSRAVFANEDDGLFMYMNFVEKLVCKLERSGLNKNNSRCASNASKVASLTQAISQEMVTLSMNASVAASTVSRKVTDDEHKASAFNNGFNSFRPSFR